MREGKERSRKDWEKMVTFEADRRKYFWREQDVLYLSLRAAREASPPLNDKARVLMSCFKVYEVGTLTASSRR